MRSEDSIQFTQNLNGFLKKDKKSVASVAKKLGINKSTLHNWQNGVLPQGLPSLLKVARYFNVSVNDLIFGKEKNSILHQVSLEEKYEIIIRKIEPKKEPRS